MHESGTWLAGDDGPLDSGRGAVSVTKAAGFLASGLSAGLRSSGGRDLALVLNTGRTMRPRVFSPAIESRRRP